MGEFRYACVKYCAHLERNVVMESYFKAGGEQSFECLNKADCSYDECGCRNSLMQRVPIGAKNCGEGVA